MNIGDMQRKLSLWATQDKERTFYDLYSLLVNDDWIRLAHDHVARNAGSVTAGCDGITMQDFDEHLERNLHQLLSDLKARTFAPQPVRRVYIPKAHGKVRPLGIPAIRDRIVQEALRMILEPIFEADFSQYSFGFRPNRRTMDAVRYIQWSASERKKFFWVIEGDIASYFDTIHHPKLLRCVGRRVKDRPLLQLLGKFLRAGVMEKRTFTDTKLGTPQGGIISPLLANLYLHELDQFMAEHTALSPWERVRRRQAGLGNFTYVRYADDFVVLCNGPKRQVETMREELYTFLTTSLHLELSREKTKITHLNDGCRFLGFWIQRRLGSKGIMTTKVTIPKEAIDKMKATLNLALTPGFVQDAVTTKIIAINRIIRGWCQYYQYTSSASTQFHQLEEHLFWKMAHWLGKKFKLSMPLVMQRFVRDNTFVYEKSRLIMPGEFKSSQYRERFFKPNPYLTQKPHVTREELLGDLSWNGYEQRPGMADLRPLILERDHYTCKNCGITFAEAELQVDHIRPVRRFKQPVDANVEGNLQTLCITCHKAKTQSDRQVESRVR